MRLSFPSFLGTLTTVALAALLVAGPAAAAPMLRTDVPPLGLTALGQNGAFFDVTIAAGERQQFEIDRVNLGDSTVEARTYVGVVSTIVNGGFGAADSGAALNGASAWVDYPAEVLTLAAKEKNTATFTVAVPADTAPGQYVSSIVLENAVPDAGTGQVALDRIVRQAVAVSIRVPGALAPEFSLDRASLGEVAGSTVVSVRTTNDGNQHLAPAGTMTLADSDGAILSTHDIAMGSFYAGMSTTVSVNLGSLLAPGDYLMTLELTDPLTGVTAGVFAVPLTVAAPDLFDQATDFFAPLENLAPGFTPLLIGLLIAGLLGLVTVSVFGIRRVLRLRGLRSGVVLRD